MITFNVLDYETFAEKHIIEEYRIVDVKCYGGSPIEISDDCFDLSTEVEDWLVNNVEYFEYDAREGTLDLLKDEDAMLFKLTWL